MRWVHGDAVVSLRLLARTGQRFDAVVTSPPYFGSRVYAEEPDAFEIGQEDLSGYLDNLGRVLDGLWECLDDRGLVWFNIGDTASGSGGAGGDYNSGGSKEGRPKYRQGKTGIAPMQWCLVPSRFALMAQERGWLVRHQIVWAKTTTRDRNLVRPEDMRHVRRPLVSHEMIFMLAKTRQHRFSPTKEIEMGSVWHLPVARGVKHQAPFPEELVARCLTYTFGDDEFGQVLDPFAGSGTTCTVAERLGHQATGIDLYTKAPIEAMT